MQPSQGLSGDVLWASVSSNSLSSVAFLLKNCSFNVIGKVMSYPPALKRLFIIWTYVYVEVKDILIVYGKGPIQG